MKEFVLLKNIDWFGEPIKAGTIYKQVNSDDYHPIIRGSQRPTMKVDFHTVISNDEYFLEINK